MREFQAPLPGMEAINPFTMRNVVQGFIDGNRASDNHEVATNARDAYVDFLRDKVHANYMRREGENMETQLSRVRAVLEAVPTSMFDSTSFPVGRYMRCKVRAARFSTILQQDGETLNVNLTIVPFLHNSEGVDSHNELLAEDWSAYCVLQKSGEAYLPEHHTQPFTHASGATSIPLPRPHMFARQQHAVPVAAAIESIRQRYLQMANAYYLQTSIATMDGKRNKLLGSGLMRNLDVRQDAGEAWRNAPRPWGSLSINAEHIMAEDEWQTAAGSADMQERLLQLMECGVVDKTADYRFARDMLDMVDAGTLTLAVPGGHGFTLGDEGKVAWARAHTMKNGLTTERDGDTFWLHQELRNFKILDQALR